MDSFVRVLDFNVFGKSKKRMFGFNFFKKEVAYSFWKSWVLYIVSKNKGLNTFFQKDDNLIIPDGVGVKIATKTIAVNIQEEIAGIEVMDEILKYYAANNKKCI